jgi:TRAP-type C4-dicarboxylate transport system substrate-binding protein
LRIRDTFVALASAAIVFALPASAQDFALRVAHYFKEDHPWNKGLVFSAKQVDEDSKGRVKIDIFNGGVLGSEAQTLQFVKE